jgi:hypothetical protein
VASKPGPGSGCQNQGSEAEKEEWRAHEECARVVPETWVEEVDVGVGGEEVERELIVFGVDLVVKDRWALVLVFSSSMFRRMN